MSATPIGGGPPVPVRRQEAEAKGFLDTTGDIAVLSWQAIRNVRIALHYYSPEILRQAGIIIVGSLPVIMAITFFAGGSCGLEITIIGRQFGAPTLAPGGIVLCTVRENAPFIFGYILAAKVGCGLVAELGAMRVREEIDALEVMGVRTIAYLVTARFLAVMLVLPVIYVLSQVSAAVASYLVSAVRYADVSSGTWIYVFFSFLDVSDLIRVFIKGMVMGVFVLTVALYFGYRARGGPVEVGTATARSMAVNIVGVTVINVSLSFVFYGAGTPFPIA